MAQIKRRSVYPENREYAERDESMRLRQEAPPAYEEDDAEEYNYEPKMEKITTVLAIIAGIVICIILVILAVKIFGKFSENDIDTNINPSSPIITDESASSETEEKYVTMPNVVGMDVEQAKQALIDLGLIADTAYEESETVALGVVIRTGVSVDAQVEKGTTVALIVSSGTKGIEVPKVSGMTFEQANSVLTNSGFLVNKEEAYSDSVEAGIVISQIPTANNQVPKDTVITVTVSLGKEETKVQVPNLIGMSEEDGIIKVTESGLVIGDITTMYSDEVAEGLICYQSYSPETWVEDGTKLDIKVSQGKRNATYKCNASIAAPTVEEAPDYVTGTEVEIVLTADDGQVLMTTKTATFPQAANYYGLTSAGGTITMTYQVTVAGMTTTNPITGETVTEPATQESRSFTRRIEFVQE